MKNEVSAKGNGFWKNPVVAFLTSLKLSAALMAGAAIASGYATFFESAWGRDGAYDVIYAARWFEVLLILLTANMVLLFVKRWPYELRQMGFMLVHLSIIVILVGAGMTRYLGYEGIMPIREGESTDFIYSDRLHVQLTQDGSRSSFPVRLWKPGANSLKKNVRLNGRTYELGVSEYWPHFEESWQEGPGGRPGLQYGVRQGNDFVDRTMREGDTDHIGGVEARFLRMAFQGEMTTSRLGEVRLRVGDQSCSFPVAWPDDQVHECGGWTFEAVEFQTDFKVGAPASASGHLHNPMIKLAITSPDGVKGERTLFAFHPDFSMGHGGGDTSFEELDLLYQVNAGFELSAGGMTGIQARASFDLMSMVMDSEDQVEIPAGTVFDLVPETLYQGTGGNNFSFVPVNVWKSVVKAPALSNDPDAPAAARLFVRDDLGNEAEVIALKHRDAQPVQLGDQTLGLAWASVIKKLPYRVQLDDFVLETYPGSDNPATYESWVSLYDTEMGVEGRKVHIFMNHPMNHRNTKHFQSSYDPDRKGTVLSVNHDPGKWPTYFGYFLISLGFVLVLLKDLLWPRKRKTGLAADPVNLVVALVALALAAVAAPALAQTDDHAGHNHPPGQHPAPATGYVALSEPAREAASRLIIQDYRGRMKPLDTMAREMVMKIYKRSKLKDGDETRLPVDVFMSWSLNASFWLDKPIIGVRYPGLKDLLGVSHDTKHVSLSSLVDERGQYRLTQAVRDAHRTPDRERSKTQRKLISFDERANLLNMVFSGAGLRFYPVPGDENNTWKIHQEVRSSLDPQQTAQYDAAFGALSTGMRTGDNSQIMAGIIQTADIQREFGAEVIPSKNRIDAELTYNRGHIFSWSMVPFLGAFFIMMPVFLVNLFRNQGRPLSFKNPFYSLGLLFYVAAFGMGIYAYVLRWIASGRAPISNGHESLLFIALAVALAGLIFELIYRMAVPAALGGLLTVVVLGVSMLSTFDPAIGPLVPVLVSYWLNIHVTIITSSYGFLGLACLIGMLILILYMTKKPGRENVKQAIKTLDSINYNVMVAGLGLLTIGTLLGGVWANESWGRYWGWDAKETWSLVTILVYATVLHFRFIPKMKSAWLTAALSTAALSSVIMTYFGVNYFLTGLHSYASGDAAKVPDWAYVAIAIVMVLMLVSGTIHSKRKWEADA